MNVYYQRQAATERPCYVCRRPTTTVLATLTADDHVYTCEGHLTDPGFATPIGPSAEEIRKVVAEEAIKAELKAAKAKAAAAAKAKAAKEDAGAGDDKDEHSKDQDGKDKQKPMSIGGSVKDESAPASTPSTPTATHKKYALHRGIFAMRQNEKRRREQGTQAKAISKGPPWCILSLAAISFRKTYAYCVHLATCLRALAIATSVRSHELPTACTVANCPGTGTVPRSPFTRLIATIGLDMLTLLGDDILCHIAKAIVTPTSKTPTVQKERHFHDLWNLSRTNRYLHELLWPPNEGYWSQIVTVHGSGRPKGLSWRRTALKLMREERAKLVYHPRVTTPGYMLVPPKWALKAIGDQMPPSPSFWDRPVIADGSAWNILRNSERDPSRLIYPHLRLLSMPALTQVEVILFSLTHKPGTELGRFRARNPEGLMVNDINFAFIEWLRTIKSGPMAEIRTLCHNNLSAIGLAEPGDDPLTRTWPFTTINAGRTLGLVKFQPARGGWQEEIDDDDQFHDMEDEEIDDGEDDDEEDSDDGY